MLFPPGAGVIVKVGIRICVTGIALFAMLHSAPRAAADLASARQQFEAGHYRQAVEALNEYLAGPPSPAKADDALYLLGSIRLARGETGKAVRAWEDLVEQYPKSPWSLNARAALIRNAMSTQRWSDASNHIVAFLDRYVEQPQSGIDDLVCRERFAQLVECAKHASPGRTMKEIHAALRQAHPPTSAAGRVVSFLADVDPADPRANLVRNPGFELDGREIGTPVGWRYRGTARVGGDEIAAGENVEDDFDGTIADGTRHEIIRARSGTFAAGKYTQWGQHRGWLLQPVEVLDGKRYDVSVFGHTPATQGQPGQLRLGADPQGGTDPESDSVVWTDPVSPREDYERLALDGPQAITARGNRITVFLELAQPTPVAANAMLFDDVVVRQSH